MNLMDRETQILIVMALGLLAMLIVPTASPNSLMKRVRGALSMELGAKRLFVAFAIEADARGCGSAASLFRALAESERIHAAAHQRIIREPGGSAQDAGILRIAGWTLADAQQMALRGFRDRDAIYARLLKGRDVEENHEAIRVFELVRTAEARNAVLCHDLLERRDVTAGSGQKTYSVCSVCGFVAESQELAHCPSCGTQDGSFVSVS